MSKKTQQRHHSGHSHTRPRSAGCPHKSGKHSGTNSSIIQQCMAFVPVLVGFVYVVIISILKWCVPTRSKNISNEVVLITGASSGIGRCLAKEIAALHPKKLILWSRNEDKLQSLTNELQMSNVDCIYMTCDVSDKSDIYSKASEVLSTCGEVTILINNAGYVNGFNVLDSDENNMEYTLRTNTLGQIRVVKAFLPKMVEIKRGHIVCMNSMLGLIGIPGAADYVASKFALTGFMEALRVELDHAEIPIKLLDVHPYKVNTDMFKGCQTRFPLLFPGLDAQYVAKATVKAIRQEKNTLILPGYMRFLCILKSVLPDEAWLLIQKYFHVEKVMETFYKRNQRK